MLETKDTGRRDSTEPLFAFCPRTFPAQRRLFRWAVLGVIVTLAAAWLIVAWSASANSKVAGADPGVFYGSIALGVLAPAILAASLLLLERPGPQILTVTTAGVEAQFEGWRATTSRLYPWATVRFSDLGESPRVRAQSAIRSISFRTERELFETLRRASRPR